MKTCIMYSGFIRSWDTCRPNHEVNLKGDRYFYAPEEPPQPYKQFVQDHNITYYKDTDHSYDANRNPITQLHGSKNQWHVNYIHFSLVPTDYQVYVKARSDIEISEPIDFSDYDYPDDTIYIPSGNDHCGGDNDQLVFGSYQSMKKYVSIYTEHHKIFEAGHQFHTEAYVTENLRRQGVKVIRIPQTTTIIRQNNPSVFSTKTKWIRSEQPADHWGMLNCKDRVVLDAGCGRNSDNVPTPEYFLSKGASMVYGVEMSHSEKPYYDSLNNPKLKVFTDAITTKEQFHYYLMLLAPDVIKMDIEGHESLLETVDVADMAPVQEIAVEYHGQAMRHLIEHNYQRLGFQDIEFYKLQNFDSEEQGVIYLKK